MSEEVKNKAIEIYESYYYLMPTSLSEKSRNELALKCAKNDIQGIIELLDNEGYGNEYIINFYKEVKNQIKSI